MEVLAVRDELPIMLNVQFRTTEYLLASPSPQGILQTVPAVSRLDNGFVSEKLIKLHGNQENLGKEDE